MEHLPSKSAEAFLSLSCAASSAAMCSFILGLVTVF
jgi:hypothetical protein